VVALAALLCLSQTVAEGLEYTMGRGLAVFSDEARSLTDSRATSLVGWAPLLGVAFCLALTAAKLIGRSLGPHEEGQTSSVLILRIAAVVFFVPALVEQRWLVAWAPFGAASIAVAWRQVLAPLGRRIWRDRPLRLRASGIAALIGLGTPAFLEALSPFAPYDAQRAGEAFLRRVRTLTPPATPSEYGTDAHPTYGVLTYWSVGHLFTYLAGRPALASNFWGLPGHDRANRAALRLYLTSDCEAVAERMAEMSLRYVLITPVDPRLMIRNAHRVGMGDLRRLVDAKGRLHPAVAKLFVMRLGVRDGESFVQPGREAVPVPACGRFRLVAETLLRPGPANRPGDFKLYERVAGAMLETRCERGRRVVASLPLVTERGRKLSWSSALVCPETGVFRMPLPYPTDGSWGPVKVVAPHYRIRVGDGPTRTAFVSAAETRTGQRVVAR
jgi:hypothetical protein